MHTLVRELRALTDSVVQSSDPKVRRLLTRVAPVSRERMVTPSTDAESFFVDLGDSLLRLRGLALASLRLECLGDCCRYLFLSGSPRKALALCEHALDLSRRCGRKSEQRKFLSLFGVLSADIGEYARAIEYFAQAINLAEEMKDPVGQISCWSNLSAAMLDAGLYAEAVGASMKAAECIPLGDGNSRDLLARCKTNAALAFHRIGNSHLAASYAKQSVQLSSEPVTGAQAHSRMVREENLISILVDCGEISLARQHANYMRTLTRKFPSERLAAITTICEGLIDVFGGDCERGTAALESVVSNTKVRESPPIYCDAIIALIRAYQAQEHPEEALARLSELLEYLNRVRLELASSSLDIVRRRSASQITVVGNNLQEHERTAHVLRARVAERELARARLEVLERLAVVADIKEDISGEHGYRVGRLSALLAREIGWERDACEALDIAARLHDIGKSGIPDKILFDAKTLREAEKHFISSHTTLGAELLSRSDIPQVRVAEEIALCHHEWWDGEGYPRQLKGTGIPKSARIVALADAFDAMTHGRPYALAMPIDAALDQIASLRGRQFDPELTDYFLALVRRLAATNEDLDAYLGKAARNSPFLKARAKIKELLAKGRESTALSPTPPPPGTPLND